MTGYFFDSSALAKLYHPEVGTAEVFRIFSRPERRILISRLTLVEIESVLAIKVRTGVIVRQDAESYRQRVAAQVADGHFQILVVENSHYLAAELLLRQYAFDHRLRTLDALQLAVAIRVRDQGFVDHFVAADKSICEVAGSKSVNFDAAEPTSVPMVLQGYRAVFFGLLDQQLCHVRRYSPASFHGGALVG